MAYQILTNDDQMLILCPSYFVTTVLEAPFAEQKAASLKKET